MSKNTNLKYFILLIIPFLMAVNIYGQAVVSGNAPVNPPVGGFRLDGDLKANTPANTGDWLPNTVAGATGGSVLTAAGVPIVNTTTYHRTDLYTNGDNIFEGGLKKDHDLNSYRWKSGNPTPSKCDINNFLMHISDDANGDTWITLAGDRESTSGNSFISIALLQKMMTKETDGSFKSQAPSSTGGRTVGDVQISAEFTGGGSNPNLYLEEWRNVGGVYKWVTFSITPMPAFGATNSAVISGMPYDVFGGTSYSINSFIEVSVNISEIYRNTATPCVGSISTMFVMTKSSQSVTADLADFVDPLQVNLDINVGKPTASGATYCVDQTIQNLTVTGESGATFKWYSDEALTNLLYTGSSFATGVSNAAASTNNYYVTQTLKGCQSQATPVTLKINPNPSANAGTAPTAQCQDPTNGNTFNLSGSGTNGNPSWAVQNNPNGLTVAITNGDTYTPSVKVSGGTGSVTLRLTVASTSTPSCGNATNDVTVVVNPNPTANAEAAPAVQCQDPTNGNTFSLSGSGSNGNPSWAIQSNPNNLTVDPIINGNTFSPSVKVSGGSGSVTLRLTVNSNATPSCSNTTSDVTVVVNSKPTANAGSTPADQCYNTNGNTFNLTGTGTNGTPLWDVKSNPNNFTVNITNGNTLTPSVKLSGNTNGGSVTLRLTVTSNATPSCGFAQSEVTLTVKAQIIGPDADILPIICTDAGFKLKIKDPDPNTIYTVTQPCNSAYSSSIPAGAGEKVFENLKFAAGYRIIATKNGCDAAPSICGGEPCTDICQTNAPLTQVLSQQGNASSIKGNEIASTFKSTEVETVNARIEAAKTKVLAAPNPFYNKIKFTLVSEVSGQGSLEIYNMLGQKVKTVFQGYVQKGQVQNIEYNVPGAQRSNLIYIFKVGDQQVTGKLIGLK
ncbi:hypothetical protein OCK74_15480 [Chitinophagaceae bacterium LB-8]|uniref:Ig-like domain-containing protein n=1 Tax=Paraflavisolibacter caeni TaxID=2982496 RepID=A0A9X2XW67_9BACT|nr:hypothetical protein [Paraflavisolibacter caeni]MCU7550519.1 hypothetical protein [Paraflavisolibacter caeni]